MRGAWQCLTRQRATIEGIPSPAASGGPGAPEGLRGPPRRVPAKFGDLAPKTPAPDGTVPQDGQAHKRRVHRVKVICFCGGFERI